jgi:hypothetical protein
VGVTFVEDDGVDFKSRVLEMQKELNKLNTDANVINQLIMENLKYIL